jgi:ATP-dependent Clp protease ATP-binding subunit ClpA
MEELKMQGLLLDIALEAASIAKEHRNEFVTPEHVVYALTKTKYALFDEDNANEMKDALDLYFAKTQLPNSVECEPDYSESLMEALDKLDDKPDITYLDVLTAMVSSASDLVGDFTKSLDKDIRIQLEKDAQDSEDKQSSGGKAINNKVGYIQGIPPYLCVLPENELRHGSLLNAYEIVEGFVNRSPKAVGFKYSSPTAEDAIREVLTSIHNIEVGPNGEIVEDRGNFIVFELNLQAFTMNKGIEASLFDSLTEILNVCAKIARDRQKAPIVFASRLETAAEFSPYLGIPALNACKKIAESFGIILAFSGGYAMRRKVLSHESACYISDFGLELNEYVDELSLEVSEGIRDLVKEMYKKYNAIADISYSKFAELLEAYGYDEKIEIYPDRIYISDLVEEDSVLYKVASKLVKDGKFPNLSIGKREFSNQVHRKAQTEVKESKEGDDGDSNSSEPLATRLRRQVFGQNKAIDTVCEFIDIHRAGLSDPTKPIGNFLFVGPTGVGKTELAKVLAKEMGYKLLRYDMSEFSEGHTVAKFTGSPAGYVGYDDSRTLVDEINASPKCVLLLDEIEKAHPKVYNLLLQIMDAATLTNGRGVKASFKDVVLIMTSNAGAADSKKMGIGFNNEDFNKNEMKSAVERAFTPEFRGRLSAVVEFNDLSNGIYADIVCKELHELCDRAQDNNPIIFKYSGDVVKHIVESVDTKRSGAREIKSFILRNVATKLSKSINEFKGISFKKYGLELFSLDIRLNKESNCIEIVPQYRRGSDVIEESEIIKES